MRVGETYRWLPRSEYRDWEFHLQFAEGRAVEIVSVDKGKAEASIMTDSGGASYDGNVCVYEEELFPFYAPGETVEWTLSSGHTRRAEVLATLPYLPGYEVRSDRLRGRVHYSSLQRAEVKVLQDRFIVYVTPSVCYGPFPTEEAASKWAADFGSSWRVMYILPPESLYKEI